MGFVGEPLKLQEGGRTMNLSRLYVKHVGWGNYRILWRSGGSLDFRCTHL